jgi:serine protease Do
MTWLWIVLGFLLLLGGGMSYVRKRMPSRAGITVTDTRSYFGVDRFDTTDGGVTFSNVEPPGGPADKAGLVGGDVIISFDGKPVDSSNDISDILRRTPIGKTVEVIFNRDGDVKKTVLTTISKAQYDELERAFDRRPEGKGHFGFESDEMTRINQPETRTFGVRLDEVIPNGPADLAGIKEGDIITDFGEIPIRTSDEFLSRVRRAIPYTTVNIGVLRGGQRMSIPVKIGKAR